MAVVASRLELAIWLGRRLVAGAAVIWAVCTTAFIVGYVVTDPAAVYLPLDVSDQLREQVRHNLGLDRPLWDQYWDFLVGLTRLDIGDSFWQQRSAFEIALERLPRTLILTAGATSLMIMVAPPLALFISAREKGTVDRIATTLAMAALSAPPFWVGYLLILVFAVHLGWVPTSGSTDWRSILLPTVVLALPGIGRLLLLMRSEGLTQLRQPYMLVAKARGFSSSHLLVRHTFRNVGAAAATFGGWELTRMIAGYSVVVETVFGWPGIGELTRSAATHQDLILLQACLVVTAALIVVINIALDILRSVIDPRVRLT